MNAVTYTCLVAAVTMSVAGWLALGVVAARSVYAIVKGD